MARDIPATIRALLAKAEDKVVTQPERDSYREKALKLMAEHNIAEALVRGIDPKLDPITHKTVRMNMPHSRAVTMHLAALAPLLGATALILSPEAGSRAYGLHIFGRQSVIQRLEMLLLSLTTQAHTALSAYFKVRQSDRTLSRAFVIGYCREVVYRMEAINAREKRDLVQSDADRYALVLVSDLEKAKAALAESYPKIRTTRLAPARDRDYLAAGRAAGRNADLGQTRVGGGRAAIGA